VSFVDEPPDSFLICQTAKNIQPIGRRIRCQKIRNRVRRASRTAKEFHWPFGDAYVLNVTVLAGIVFRDIFELSNERERRFGTYGALGKRKRIGVGCEGVVIVAAVFEVGRTALWVTPNAVFQNIVPNIAAASLRQRRIRAHKIRVYNVRVTVYVHAKYFDIGKAAVVEKSP
jgi:hypothetical protein